MQEANRDSKKLLFKGKRNCETFPKFVSNTKFFSVDRVTKAMGLYSTHFQKQMKIFFLYVVLSNFMKTPLVKA